MLLKEEDKQAIAGAIKQAELLTSGEIVFAVTEASSHYHHATLQGALAGMFITTAAYLALPLTHSIGLVLWTEIIAFALFYSVIPHLPWRRHLIPKREMDASVYETAFHEFYASGLYKTREANGVLIFLSLLERRVVVLGDKGIHDRMGDSHWQDVRNLIIDGIKQGKAREGVCAAVNSCGQALATHFPRRADDINELPDDVIDRSNR